MAGLGDGSVVLIGVEAHESGLHTTQVIPSKWNYEPATIRNAVWEARRRGFLTATERGRQGGQLTPKAIGILATKGNDDGEH